MNNCVGEKNQRFFVLFTVSKDTTPVATCVESSFFICCLTWGEGAFILASDLQSLLWGSDYHCVVAGGEAPRR